MAAITPRSWPRVRPSRRGTEAMRATRGATPAGAGGKVVEEEAAIGGRQGQQVSSVGSTGTRVFPGRNKNDSHLMWPTSGGSIGNGYARPMVKILLRWALLAAALLFVAHVLPGVTVVSFMSALWAALILGLLNTLLRPVLVLLTLPVTVVTLGLFLFVINALMFYFAAGLLDGLAVAGFGSALLGALVYSACGLVIDVAIEGLFGRRG
ncbi:MAG: hypothetical protein M1823_006538 [Watsoniomyces obsoletus]|nr:MAG: hypothetical protein M1823_006538 [Watsoniomyces obsoletus]